MLGWGLAMIRFSNLAENLSKQVFNSSEVIRILTVVYFLHHQLRRAFWC